MIEARKRLSIIFMGTQCNFLFFVPLQNIIKTEITSLLVYSTHAVGTSLCYLLFVLMCKCQCFICRLGDVLASLTSKKDTIPYENSVLTKVLADSLGGKCPCTGFLFILYFPHLVNYVRIPQLIVLKWCFLESICTASELKCMFT